ncbi:hypothetical protein THAOC_23172, partial [Thalassiosira oceanica]
PSISQPAGVFHHVASSLSLTFIPVRTSESTYVHVGGRDGHGTEPAATGHNSRCVRLAGGRPKRASVPMGAMPMPPVPWLPWPGVALGREVAGAGGSLVHAREHGSLSSSLEEFDDDWAFFFLSGRLAPTSYHTNKTRLAEAPFGPASDDNGPGSETQPHDRFRYV